MNITEVKIHLLGKDSGFVKALAEIVIDGSVAVRELRIVKTRSGDIAVSWPASQHSIHKVNFIANPINDAARRYAEQVIISAYNMERAKSAYLKRSNGTEAAEHGKIC